jgi:hypothetical protein
MRDWLEKLQQTHDPPPSRFAIHLPHKGGGLEVCMLPLYGGAPQGGEGVRGASQKSEKQE